MTLYKKGIILALLCAFFSGVANYVNKYAVMGIKDPLVHTTIKNLIVGLILFFLLIRTRKISQIHNLDKNSIFKLFFIGIVGGSLPFYLFFTGLMYTNPINASLLHKTLFIWVALLALPFLGEKFHLSQLIGIILIIYANYFLGSFRTFSFGTGEWMILSATLFWAIEQIIAKKLLKTLDPDFVSGARMIVGSLILLLAVVITGKSQMIFNLSFYQWCLTLTTSLLLFGYVFTWYRALSYMPVTLVATILTSATIVTNLLSVSWSTLPVRQLVESGFIGLGILIFSSLPLLQKIIYYHFRYRHTSPLNR